MKKFTWLIMGAIQYWQKKYINKTKSSNYAINRDFSFVSFHFPSNSEDRRRCRIFTFTANILIFSFPFTFGLHLILRQAHNDFSSDEIKAVQRSDWEIKRMYWYWANWERWAQSIFNQFLSFNGWIHCYCHFHSR